MNEEELSEKVLEILKDFPSRPTPVIRGFIKGSEEEIEKFLKEDLKTLAAKTNATRITFYGNDEVKELIKKYWSHHE